MVEEMDPEARSFLQDVSIGFFEHLAGIESFKAKARLGSKRHLLKELLDRRLARIEHDRYFPAFLAIETLPADFRNRARHSTSLVLRAAKRLYEQSGPKDFEMQQILIEAKNEDSNITMQDICLGMFIASEFTEYWTGWASASDGLINVLRVQETILDFESIEQSWQRELDRRNPKTNNTSKPAPAESVEPLIANDKKSILDQALVCEIACRFIFSRLGTPESNLADYLAAHSSALARLTAEKYLRKIGDRYFPGFLALNLLNDPIREYCMNCTEVLLDLLNRVKQKSKTPRVEFGDLVIAAKEGGREFSVEEATIGVMFATDFGHFVSGYSLWGTGNAHPGDVIGSLIVTNAIDAFQNLEIAWFDELRDRRKSVDARESSTVNDLRTSFSKLPSFESFLRPICELYLREGLGTPIKPLRVRLNRNERSFLNKLLSEGYLEQLGDNYFPTFESVDLIAGDVRVKALEKINKALGALRKLYVNSPTNSFQAQEIMNEIQSLGLDITQIELETALRLMRSVGIYSSSGGDMSGRVSSVTLTESVLDFNTAEEFWKEKMKDRGNTRSSEDYLPFTKMTADESMQWDVFICHASEDKEEFVRLLAEALRNEGLGVWFDEFTFTMGDSIRQMIDRGLLNSRFGIVVLSPAFFAKQWPQKELDGLAARETTGEKIILPIWHDLEAEDVRSFSPMLAGKYAVRSKAGIAIVVQEILKVVRR